MEIAALQRALAEAAEGLSDISVMEVCGTHTHAIWRHGIRQLIPKNIRLVSGPGCPVCVTDDAELSAAFYLLRQKEVTLCTFGDMLRVPCGGESLSSLSASGADARALISPLDALDIAKENPKRAVVWFGVGFETTAPHTAALAEAAAKMELTNLFVFCAHKTMPAALRALMGENSNVDALLCPGHVAAVAGAEIFRFVPEELRLPAAVAGFEAEDILAALVALVRMIKRQKPTLVNAYPRAVTAQGNPAAKALVDQVFTPCAARWRGLGEIPQSGLQLRDEYAALDAAKRFDIPEYGGASPSICRCAQVLRGRIAPNECAAFARACTPQNPLGPCMVSAEGACAAYYAYGGNL